MSFLLFGLYLSDWIPPVSKVMVPDDLLVADQTTIQRSFIFPLADGIIRVPGSKVPVPTFSVQNVPDIQNQINFLLYKDASYESFSLLP